MGTGKDFSRVDRICAKNFLNICLEQGVRNIIYL